MVQWFNFTVSAIAMVATSVDPKPDPETDTDDDEFFNNNDQTPITSRAPELTLFFFHNYVKAKVYVYGDIEDIQKRDENVIYLSNHQCTVLSNKITEEWQHVAIYDDKEFTVYILWTVTEEVLLCVEICAQGIAVGDDVSIDGTDIVVKYDWKYSDGSDVTYMKWAPGEPSSILCFWCEERCLALQNEIPFGVIYFEGMNNMKCGDARPYICQLHIYA
ncbi:AGPAT5 [Mytilus edulis]|uniref:AGPAT5 n=1 Tax=Mytilus edulis TaxID=6550 RepID=A0A8S3V269_MYTED|nr:AGPAT5 [Mytilus edulis]